LQQNIKDAKLEYDALFWLVENYISIDNVIYYSHKNEFCFGWKTVYSTKEETEIRKKLKSFPYKYYFKT